MTGAEGLVTFGLPALALGWAFLMARKSRRDAEALDAVEMADRKRRTA